MQEYAHEFAEHWYSLPTPMQAAGGSWIVRAGHNKAKPHYGVGPKSIQQYGFHFIKSGMVQVTCGGITVELGESDAFCLFPGKSYVYQAIPDSAKELQMVWIALDGPQVSLLLLELGLKDASFHLKRALDHRVWATIRQFILYFQKGKTDPMREQSLLYELLWKIKQNTDIQRASPKRHWVAEVKQYLELHCTENIKIDHIARHVGVHRSHLYTAFMKEFDCSPMQYLQRLRLEKGAQLLKHTGLSVTEAALSLGYPDLFSFTRAFTKMYGISPKGYRG
ncbi:AraC-type DNA-binding protein [Paenibacillus sp. 1_12]|uniref:AraC family transcriptional regulator n=1 Tax=Paenibacillus sp. 1_12 TaxID=1566278 RepID=UPI0008F0A21E|nr:AraC family transcriptional regulator [Paenibacillus sp. 1_12]SFK98972.1 AraC-type DNA-binding protein [Paenibacillus sp. 1_12]